MNVSVDHSNSDAARPELFTTTLLVAVPIALLFNLFLRRFIAGFTMGAVKG